MAYKQDFLRLVLQGSLYDVEEFSFSLSFGHTGSSHEPITDVPPAVITACTTYFSNGSMLSNKAKLQVIKLNNIGPDGRYVQPYTVEYEYPTPVAGGSSAKPPAQNALAVSTTTGFSRGRAHQGRWYLPIPGAVLADDGRIDPTATSYILQSSRAFVTQLNAALSPWVASVVSNVGPGEQRTITGLKVGRVMDTIRSRREKFDEDYVIGPVP